MANTMVERAVRCGMACATLAGALVVVAGMPMSAEAQASSPARCEALKLKKESAFYECLSRCERRAARGRVDGSDCDARCEAAYDAAIFRVEQSPPCQPEPTVTPTPDPDDPGDSTPPPRRTVAPDPEQCEAELLQIQARHLLCRVRCDAREGRNEDFDEVACNAGCDERCQTALEASLAKPVCASGRVPSGEMRQEADH